MIDARAVAHERDHLGLADVGGIAGELGRAMRFGDVEPQISGRGSPDPFQAARAARFCSAIAVSNPARSTASPCARSASSVRS